MHVVSYADEVWWLLHHSYNPANKTFALTAYIDDSGSDDESALTALGGVIMSRGAFKDFSKKWSKFLKSYRVPEPLHMTDFVRPHGKHIGMHREMKLALFRDAAKVINDHKIYSVSVSVSKADFDSVLSAQVRHDVIGPYAMAFLSAVLFVHGVSKSSLALAAERVAYIVDTGFSFSDQLVKAHTAIIENSKKRKSASFVGTLGFGDDRYVPALQAADVVAWSARRQELRTLVDEFEPLNDVLHFLPVRPGHAPHSPLSISKNAIKSIAPPIQKWLAGGPMPGRMSRP